MYAGVGCSDAVADAAAVLVYSDRISVRGSATILRSIALFLQASPG